ncbi:MAG: M4 family metallopeptidase [Bacteroidia bacterium]|nr:M4 family metallopeptidase [Bacteroidia bacterium]
MMRVIIRKFLVFQVLIMAVCCFGVNAGDNRMLTGNSSAIGLNINQLLINQGKQILPGTTWEFINVETDLTNTQHYRFQQFIDGVPVENAIIIVHAKTSGNQEISGLPAKGLFIKPAGLPESYNTTSQQNRFKELLLRTNPDFRNHSQEIVIDSLFVLWSRTDDQSAYKLKYRIIFSFHNDLHQHEATVDYSTNQLENVFEKSCFADVVGTAQTVYHGNKSIPTWSDGVHFTLKNTTKGKGIETLNLNSQNGYSQVSSYSDYDNSWNASSCGYAADAHYCAVNYYDFLHQQFNRNSIDNNGMKLISYLNYGQGLLNAFWNGSAVVYGSGNATATPLTTLDISGHEFTHGLIQKSANLNYSGEPGIINEGIADIFGVALESHANGVSGNWTIGEASGTTLRSISNPNLFNQPDTYQGTFWYYGTGDNGGVHINSGFINYWYYLLAQGGTGINDHGTSYQITGISAAKAIKIVYQSLVGYTTPSTGFYSFRDATLKATIDLYGSCSPEYIAVLNAWKAVGIGNSGTDPVTINTASTPEFCEGDSILLKATGLPGSNYVWKLNGNTIFTGNTNEIFVHQQGLFTVTENRCGLNFTSAPVNIIRHALPVVTATDISGCEGISLFPVGSPAGGNFNILVPYSGSATDYNYTYTSVHGCTASATAKITRFLAPSTSFITSDFTIPQNASPVVLEATGMATFSGAGVVGSNLFDASIAGIGGPWSLIMTDVNGHGCMTSDSILVTVTEPCNRDFTAVEIQVPEIIKPNVPITISAIGASGAFKLNWKLPAGWDILSGQGTGHLLVIPGDEDGTIKLTITNTCLEAYEITSKILDVASDLRVNIYPNPVTDYLIIGTNSADESGLQLLIFDSSSKLISEISGTFNQPIYLPRELTNGNYIVQFRDKQNQLQRKSIIVVR